MTTEKFMGILAENKGIEWFWTTGGMIRGEVSNSKLEQFCPITWVGYRCGYGFRHVHQFLELAQRMGLDTREAEKIAQIADNSDYDPDDVSAALFAACGLKEDDR